MLVVVFLSFLVYFQGVSHEKASSHVSECQSSELQSPRSGQSSSE